MIRPINIKLNAAHPELPLVEATTFTGAPSSVFIRGVPKAVGNWSITAVNVAVTYPDNSTTTRAAVESAEGVWVATIPGTATSGRTVAGFRILADGIDENGAAVTGYVLGFADFSVLSFTPVPAPGGTFWLLRYFDAMPTTPKKGDVAVVGSILKYYNGTTWLPFGIDDYSQLSNKPSINGVTLLGDKTAADLGLASTADATLVNASDWVCSPAEAHGDPVYIVQDGNGAWRPSDGMMGTGAAKGDAQSLSLSWAADEWYGGVALTATRAALGGYVLGSQTDKPLASEAEAEALRTGLALIAPDWVQTSAYSAYDCVKHNGAYYYAKADIAANTAWNADNWGSLANLAALAHLFLPLTGGTVTGSISMLNGILDAGDVQTHSYFDFNKPFENPRYLDSPENSGKALTDADILDSSSALGTALAGKLGNSGDQTITSGTQAIGFGFDATDPWIKFTDGNGNTVYAYRPSASGTLALAAPNPTAGNLAALDADGNPTDAGWTAGNLARYALMTKTISNGAVTLDDRAINAVAVSSSLASLTVNFPTATSGKVRDFGLRLTVASGITTAPELALPQGVVCENADGEAPEIGADGAATILYFTETASGVFLVKGEVITAIS